MGNQRQSAGSNATCVPSPPCLPPPPPRLSPSSPYLFLSYSPPSQPCFHFSLHTNDWAPRLSANSFIPHSTPQLGVADNSIVQIQLHARWKHQRTVVWKLCFASPLLFSLSLHPAQVFFFFCHLFFFNFFRYVRQAEVEQASKWMAKPPFPLLTLPFMHVILVPVPSLLFPPSSSLFRELSIPLRILMLHCTLNSSTLSTVRLITLLVDHLGPCYRRPVVVARR